MSSTGRDLRNRLLLLLALALAATVALFCAYRAVHTDAVPLASSTSSGVLELDTAKDALLQAQAAAVQDAASDRAGTGDFHTQMSVADQGVTLAAADDVTGPSGRLAVQTVTSLMSGYGGWVELAAQERAGTLLHDTYMRNAEVMLGSPADSTDRASVMGRINQLQQEQLAVVDRQAAFGWELWLRWSLAAALVLALAAALAEAQGFLRARFRRRWNRWLGGAFTLLAAGTALLAAFTWRTHRGLFHSRALLHRSLTGPAISGAESGVARQMAGTGLRAATTDWILVGGLVLMALIGAALWPRFNEYRARAPR